MHRSTTGCITSRASFGFQDRLTAQAKRVRQTDIVPRSAQGIPQHQVCHRHEDCHIATVALASPLPLCFSPKIFWRFLEPHPTILSKAPFGMHPLWLAILLGAFTPVLRTKANSRTRFLIRPTPPPTLLLRKILHSTLFWKTLFHCFFWTTNCPSTIGLQARLAVNTLSFGALNIYNSLFCLQTTSRGLFVCTYLLRITRKQESTNQKGSKGARTFVRPTTWDPKTIRGGAFANKNA